MDQVFPVYRTTESDYQMLNAIFVKSFGTLCHSLINPHQQVTPWLHYSHGDEFLFTSFNKKPEDQLLLIMVTIAKLSVDKAHYRRLS
jgi:hypothetical protein